MRINTNISALNAHRQLGINNNNSTKSMERLSSGFRINRAGDDAAGLAISEKMRAQIRGLNQASANAQDGISLIQTAEGALAETHEILQRMRELAVQAATDTNVEIDRDEIQKEINALTSEINRIGNTTEFNTKKLLNGGMEGSPGIKTIEATAADKTLSGTLGSTGAEFLLGGMLHEDGVTAGTQAITAAFTVEEGDVAAGTWIKIDEVVFTNNEKITLSEFNNASLIGNSFTDKDGNKLSTVAKLEDATTTTVTIESNSSGGTSAVSVQKHEFLTSDADVAAVRGDGAAIYVDGKGFDLSGFEVKTSTLREINETIERLGDITAKDGTKLSDMVKITSNEDTADTKTRLTFSAVSSGADSTIRFEASEAQLALGIVLDEHVGMVNKETGAEATGATKTLAEAAQAGIVTNSTKASVKIDTTDAAIADEQFMIVNGLHFEIGGYVMENFDDNADGEVTAQDNWDKLKNIKSVQDPNVKLGDLLTMERDADLMKLETIESGAGNSIDFTNYAIPAFNTDSTALVRGDGTAVKVGNEVFELGGLQIEVASTASREATLELLGNVVATGGTNTLSDVANISFDENDKLVFETKAAGTSAVIEIMSSADDTALGTLIASDAGEANRAAGTGVVGPIKDGTSITVNNTTFNLGGIVIEDPRDAVAVIETLGNVTSGGVKLSELADIQVKDGKLSITTKATGESSTIQFEGADGILGLTAADAGEANMVTGNNSTIERTGLEASSALRTDKDVTIGPDASFRMRLGTGDEVTIKLNSSTVPKTYNTSNTENSKSNAAMVDLVKDLNASLQTAGFDGEVSVSLSQDNKIQFISERNVDIKLNDGVNSPLANQLGFNTTDMTNVKNVQQQVGPGTQGGGFSAKLQIGANEGQSMDVRVQDMRSSALDITGNAGQVGFTATNVVTNGTNNIGAEAALDVTTHESAGKAVEVINVAIEKVSAQRSDLGAAQNRLEHTIANLGTSSENLAAAESRIRDLDMAAEMMEFTKNNILNQAATAMLAQANMAPQTVLQLLG